MTWAGAFLLPDADTLNLYGTYWAVILPTAATAFGVFLARQFLLAIPGT